MLYWLILNKCLSKIESGYIYNNDQNSESSWSICRISSNRRRVDSKFGLWHGLHKDKTKTEFFVEFKMESL